MTDISTVWDPDAGAADWLLAGPDLQSDDDLATAVLLSLFTDRRADPDDEIPDGTTNPRGWWGDAGADLPIGSKLWLLEREKQSEPVRLRAQDYVNDALQWLIDEGVVSAIATAVSWARPGMLAVQIVLSEPSGRQVTFNYQWAWKGVS